MARVMRITFTLLVVAALVGTAAPARAQAAAPTAIAGTVRDAQGGVLPGVTVSAINIGSGRELTAVTDAEGKYELAGLAPGGYRVIARLSGFSESGRSVRVEAGNRHLTLKPRDLDAYRGERAKRGGKLPRGFQRVDDAGVTE